MTESKVFRSEEKGGIRVEDARYADAELGTTGWFDILTYYVHIGLYSRAYNTPRGKKIYRWRTNHT